MAVAGADMPAIEVHRLFEDLCRSSIYPYSELLSPVSLYVSCRSSKGAVSIPESIIEEVRRRVSLVDLMSEHTEVRRSGSRFVALCPFHSEKTPSCSVSNEEGRFYCFGCGKKGDAFSLIMELRGLSFPDAVRDLAERVGVRIPDAGPAEDGNRESAKERKVLRLVSSAVAAIYQDCLFGDSGKAARAYLRSRGISEETQRHYRLGFAPDAWQFLPERVLERLRAEQSASGNDQESVFKALLQLGLIKEKKQEARSGSSRYFDLFRKRIIFPITESDGSVIAFGGRLIEPQERSPKYINSTESPLYRKRRTFYGVAPALSELRSHKHALLVEGYLDVLSLYEKGVKNVLASCGTAITAEHIQVLSRLVPRVTLIFDGDAAGRKAAANCFSLFLNSGIDARTLLLEQGEDPDSIAQRSDAEALHTWLAGPKVSLLHLYLEQLEEELGGDSPDGPAQPRSAALVGRIAERFAQAAVQIKNPVERELCINQAREFLGVTLESVQRLVAALEPENQHVHKQRTEGTAEPSKNTARKTESRAAPVPPMDESPPPWVEEPMGQGRPLAKRPPYNNRFSRGGRRGSGRKERQGPESDWTPPNREARAAGPRGFAAYEQQLVVAVLCEPRLAATVLELPSLGGDASGLPLSVNAKGFLEELANAPFDSQIHEGVGGTEKASQLLADLLKKHGLEAEPIIEESLRQLRVGGSQPTAVISQAGRVALRHQMMSELSQIRKRESSESDDALLEQLAQEKLQRRRNFENTK